ncbi:MAG: hydrogenase maturation nickel metallochaperone HypA [Bacteroidetes bacterium]|nr:hydrogenase maturation nickel metallochaperone HypA [Bacteroidota bacterium]
MRKNNLNSFSLMHEASLVQNIFDILESKFTEEELETLESIDLQVGLLSNVEPLLMKSAFEAVKSSIDKYQDVKLNMEVVDVEIFCDNCDTNSTINNYKFACAHCGQPNNNVIKGMELLIKRVHFSGEQEVTGLT